MSDAPTTDLPFVSVVIPVLNEERHIEACLNSVVQQDYPAEGYEVIVADGGSTDRTRAIVESIAARNPNVRLINNPGRLQAAGLNGAILASRGSVIARQDGHAEWGGNHLRRSAELLLSSGADNVGGLQEAAGDGASGRAIARAMGSPFGVGGAGFRYSDREQEMPTVFLGTFRRSAFERVGLFDEAYPPHEDYELNHRIRSTGGRILYSPDIRTRYHVRDGLVPLFRQYFRYGRGKVRVARANPGVMRTHHLAPPALVAAIPVLAIVAGTHRGRRLSLGGAAVYATACVIAAQQAGASESPAVRVRIPATFAVMHVAWGLGFWSGIFEAARGIPTGGGSPPRLPAGPPTPQHQRP
ncbi:MAG TPA: glycosyltransferase family 2 protein [Candidatus Saccharimonadales bacterium]|nr:glycosyltransferase family 2 protein [Candidatus Saccharimonadales bacterium]